MALPEVGRGAPLCSRDRNGSVGGDNFAERQRRADSVHVLQRGGSCEVERFQGGQSRRHVDPLQQFALGEVEGMEEGRTFQGVHVFQRGTLKRLERSQGGQSPQDARAFRNLQLARVRDCREAIPSVRRRFAEHRHSP